MLTRNAALAVVALLLSADSLLFSQSSNAPLGAQRTPQFENQDVRVWRTVVPPNAPLKMHTHQHPLVIVALTGGTVKVVYEDGTFELHNWETGKAYWLPTSEGRKRHADVNTGSKPLELIVVELKKDD
ncbi:MAG TPA: hypothetical protein VMU28_11815 [Terriglobales bacterium]|nr:hypothetical protein [Terriglobales bacterium]